MVSIIDGFEDGNIYEYREGTDTGEITVDTDSSSANGGTSPLYGDYCAYINGSSDVNVVEIFDSDGNLDNYPQPGEIWEAHFYFEDNDLIQKMGFAWGGYDKYSTQHAIINGTDGRLEYWEDKSIVQSTDIGTYFNDTWTRLEVDWTNDEPTINFYDDYQNTSPYASITLNSPPKYDNEAWGWYLEDDETDSGYTHACQWEHAEITLKTVTASPDGEVTATGQTPNAWATGSGTASAAPDNEITSTAITPNADATGAGPVSVPPDAPITTASQTPDAGAAATGSANVSPNGEVTVTANTPNAGATATGTANVSPDGPTSASATVGNIRALLKVFAITALPDEDQPALGNGVEDEIAVDRETQPTDYGDVRIQVRETGESAWDSSATGWAEQVLSYDTLTTQVLDREDGEEYEVRLRTETEHITGAWTDPVSIITDFPGAQNFAVTGAGQTSVDLEWDDVSDNEDGTYVDRRELFGTSWGEWRRIDDLPPTSGDTSTVQYTDTTVLPETTYEYRITPYTDDTSATAGPVETTTADDGVRSDRVPAQGWHAVVEAPDGSQIEPTIVGEPQLQDALNDLPTCELPVPQSARWSDAAQWERQPLRVYYDGDRLPIEEVQRVRQEPDQAVLVGVGGVDLRERVSVDLIEQDAHLVAEDLLQSETGYAAHVDDPAADTAADTPMVEADTQAEWEDAIAGYPFAADDPRYLEAGRLKTHQSVIWLRGEDAMFENSAGTFFADRFENGAAGRMSAIGDAMEWSFELGYDVPDGSDEINFRFDYDDGTHPGLDVLLDGTTVASIDADQDFVAPQPKWSDIGTSNNLAGIAAGSHTLRIEVTAAASDDSYIFVDAAAPNDTRYTGTFDNSFSSGGLADSPALHPTIASETPDQDTVRQVVAGSLTSGWDDVAGGDQAVAISNDSGASWQEATNSDAVDAAFGSGSTTIRARLTQSYYDSGSGPVVYDAGQTIDLFDLAADLEDTPLLLNRSWDQTLLTVLQDIADYGNFIFEVAWDSTADGLAIEWTQAGQRTASADPTLVDYSVETDYSSIHRRAVIYGTSRPRSSTITAQHDTWVALDHDWLQETGEQVTNASDGTEYERGADYELRPNAGELQALSTGAIPDGADLEVNYDRRIRGTFASEAADGSYETYVDDVPSITTTRNADALAVAVVQTTSDPLHTASVTVDVPPDGLSLVEAIDVAELPTDQAMEVWSVDNAPGEVRLQLGSRDQARETIDRFSRQISATSRKV